MTRIRNRLAAVFLTLAMIVTFIPVMGVQEAYADDLIPIETASFTVDVPSAGDAVPADVEGETEEYTYSYGWRLDSGNLFTGNIKPGVTYRVIFYIYPKDGYTVEFLNKSNVAINGEPCNSSGYLHSQKIWYRVDQVFHFPGETRVVSFDANGGTGAMSSVEVEENNEYKLPACTFAPPEGKEFGKWVVDGEEYDPGNKVLITEDTTVTVKWIDIVTYTVTYENNGHGVKPEEQTVPYNNLLDEPATNEDGWYLEGWYLEDSYQNKWDFRRDKVQQDVQLYAKWMKIIDSFASTVSIPFAGDAVPDMVEGETDEYTYNYSWKTDAGNWFEGTFEPGKTYKAIFTITPKDGYTIEFLNKNQVIINGETGDYYTYYSTERNQYRVDYAYTVVPRTVAIPSGKMLTYNGKAQTGVAAGTNYTVTNGSKTAAGTYTAIVSLKDPVNYAWNDGTTEEKQISYTVKQAPVTGAIVTGISNKTYTGKAQTQAPVVKVDGNTLKSGTDYTLSYKSNTKAGIATVTITGKGNYTGTISKTFTINKAANPLKISGKTATVKYSKVKKKAQTLAVSKVITTSKKGQGTVTYTKASGNKKITINKKTGKVTVKKGLKKGTYKVKVKVNAAGNGNYKAVTKTVTFKVKVK